MQRLAKDIHELVQNAEQMGKEEYLRRAVQLQYRFIRIHPFAADSNGRTSRALLNMMTIPKGILVELPKEKKPEFISASNATNKKMDEQGYFEALNGNSEELDVIEAANADLPIYDFIMQNCILEVEPHQSNYQTRPKQQVIQTEKETDIQEADEQEQ
jgi:Fic family protein